MLEDVSPYPPRGDTSTPFPPATMVETILLRYRLRKFVFVVLARQGEEVPLLHESQDAPHPTLSVDPLTIRSKVH